MTRAQYLTMSAFALALSACDNPFASQPTQPQAAAVADNVASVAPPPPPPAAMPPPAPTSTGPLRPGGTTLDQPDAQNVALLYYSFAPPAPVPEWIDADMRASGANEFERAPQRAKLEEQFRRLVEEAGKVGRIVLHVNAELSEYDAQSQRYYIDLFGSGSHMGYSYRGKSYQIDFANREDAQGWTMPPDAAARVLERNRGSRSVVVSVTLDLIGHHATSDGGSMDARVLSYVVDGRWNDTRLGQATVIGEAKP